MMTIVLSYSDYFIHVCTENTITAGAFGASFKLSLAFNSPSSGFFLKQNWPRYNQTV